jgi:hypothetical protein
MLNKQRKTLHAKAKKNGDCPCQVYKCDEQWGLE